MNNCSIIGRVTKSKIDTTPSGSHVGKARVEVVKKFTGKDGTPRAITKRFDVCVFGQDASAAGSLQPGTVVWASGEVDAYVNEHNGKTYANLQLTGRIGVVEVGEVPQAPAPRQNAPAAPPKEPKAELPPGVDDDSSDVPF